MSTNSCLLPYTYLSSTKVCETTRCCTLSRKSHEFSRLRSDALSCCASRFIDRLRLRSNKFLMRSPCSARSPKVKSLTTMPNSRRNLSLKFSRRMHDRTSLTSSRQTSRIQHLVRQSIPRKKAKIIIDLRQ